MVGSGVWTRRVGAALVSCAVLAGCSAASGSDHTVLVVGSFYPLAWLAEQAGGGRVEVADLTPPGVEAHDVNLSARQVAEVQNADVVLILGYLGFQPQVESAAHQASGRVIEVASGLDLHPSEERGLSADPHVWLDPVSMEGMAGAVARALIAVDPPGQAHYERRTDGLVRRLGALDAEYRQGLSNCRFDTFVSTHEAFGYLASRYGLHQIGIEGLTPEAEPGAARLQAAEAAIRDGTAAPAVFYEGTDEGERVGTSVASSMGVQALPLGTLEFDPGPGDYVSVMRANLASLREGLQCR